MNRSPKTVQDAAQLLQLCDLLTNSVRTIVNEWGKESGLNASATKGLLEKPTHQSLPSHELYQAQRTVLAITGSLTELVHDGPGRIQELACQFWESRALFIAAERRIPDLLAEADGQTLTAEQLGSATGIEYLKLARIMRLLCSVHVFKEVSPERFANNSISAALVHNEPLRSYVLLDNLDLYTASDHLPTYLLGSKGASYKANETPFQDAIGTTEPRWDWLEQKVVPNLDPKDTRGYPGMPGLPTGNYSMGSTTTNGHIEAPNKSSKGSTNGHIEPRPRPELEVFGLAMVGGGMVTGAAHPYDYPWDKLGNALVVDIGGGAGGFTLQLSRLYPKLKFVVQDRGPVIEQGRSTVWPKENPAALADGRVEFMEHDFFEPQPVIGADVYWLRYIIHMWSDSYCIKLLSALRPALSPTSRVLICDQVMNTTTGCDELEPAPAPLLANYGYHTRYSHQRNMAMMGVTNGIERTPAQFKDIVEAAGLVVEKIWECRSQVSIVEVRLPGWNRGGQPPSPIGPI